MSVQLLDKTRKINKLLHNNNSQKVVFNDICQVLMEVMDSNVIVISKKGKILGIQNSENIDPIEEMISGKIGDYIESDIHRYCGIISPIDIAGERFGTLFMYRMEDDYTIDDIILAEYGTTVVGLEMMRSVSEEMESERRKQNIIESAFRTLSFTELEAVHHIFDELNGSEGILVASKIADRFGITRSVIVNALRKLESAGVIESRSSGMKGTYIKVVNDLIFDELNRAGRI